MRKHELARLLGQEQAYNKALRAEKRDDTHGAEVVATDTSKAHPIVFLAQADDEHKIRVAVLAVALMLKNKTDAADVSEGAHVALVIDQYERVQRYFDLLGVVTGPEHDAAIALWEETAA